MSSMIQNDSMYQMSQVIKQKEKELQNIHEERCNQLEKMIIERDHLLIESAKRFEKLKDDFQYNLTLLEARDHEILRLDNIVEHQDEKLSNLDTELRASANKFIQLEQKYNNLVEKHSADKAKSKKVLQDLKEVIENVQWVAAEDAKSKANEIEALKMEVQNLNILKDTTLEAQRTDLSSAFEQILKQREDNFALKEQEIAQQIQQLSNRLEQLSSDNMSLKLQIQGLNRKNDDLNFEMKSKEDVIRNLTWESQDKKIELEQKQSNYENKIHDLSSKLSNLNSILASNKSGNSRIIETYENELKSLKEITATQEQCIEQFKNQNLIDKEVYERNLQNLNNDQLILHNELNKYKHEADLYLNLYNSTKTKFEFNELKLKSYESDIEKLRQENLMLIDKDHENSEKLASLKLENFQTIISLEKELENTRKALESNFNVKYKELQSELEMKQLECNVKVTSLESELSQSYRNLEEKSKQLLEEKQETAAMKLRLALLDEQIGNLKQKLKGNKDSSMNNGVFRAGSAFGSPDKYSPDSRNDQDLSTMNYKNAIIYDMNVNNNNINRGTKMTGFSSPMFSEDMGSVSLPDLTQSPGISPSVSFTANNKSFCNKSTGIIEENDEVDSLNYDGNERDVIAENESLKQIVKQMRNDIETLHQQQASSPTRSTSPNRTAALEKRLEQMSDEVNRLRTERKRLMDIGNELRATVNKQHYQSSDEGLQNFSQTSQSSYPQTILIPTTVKSPPHSHTSNPLHIYGIGHNKDSQQIVSGPIPTATTVKPLTSNATTAAHASRKSTNSQTIRSVTPPNINSNSPSRTAPKLNRKVVNYNDLKTADKNTNLK